MEQEHSILKGRLLLLLLLLPLLLLSLGVTNLRVTPFLKM